ncbi:RsmE family RNA methyltransferase [Desulfomarina sp.]
MHRFLFDPAQGNEDEFFLSLAESRHIVRVLRLKPFSVVELFDGHGSVYSGEIIELGRRVRVRRGSLLPVDSSREKSIWVAQGILKGRKMDSVVQRCTELGAFRILPVVSGRTQGRADIKQDEKRYRRWQRIIIAACKQCRRAAVPHLERTLSFQEMLEMVEAEGGRDRLKLLFWEEEKEVGLRDIQGLKEAASAVIFLGPEGGISWEEVFSARERGWRTVGLGSRILRAETAALASLSIVQHYLGNM